MAASQASAFVGAKVATRHAKGCKCTSHRRPSVRVSAAYTVAPNEPFGYGPKFHEYGGMDVSTEERDARKSYSAARTATVGEHFEGAMGMDDFMFRVEQTLAGFGFASENTVALSALCRDEYTGGLRVALNNVFGHCFEVAGLGGVISAGAIGFGAGMSHSPKDAETGKERFVFISMPHIAVDAAGKPGCMVRPGRHGTSCACGAMAAMQPRFLQYKNGELEPNAFGEHDDMNPEFCILQTRMLKGIEKSDIPEDGFDLVQTTKHANKVFTSDLEKLVKEKVDPAAADYAVITGVQVHSTDVEAYEGHPAMEFIWPTSMYVVVDGARTDIDISDAAAPSPKQLFSYMGGSKPFTLPGLPSSSAELKEEVVEEVVEEPAAAPVEEKKPKKTGLRALFNY